jgi:hypothetical protein
MDTTLQYYGRLRTARHCGVLNGRDVYYLDVDLLAPRINVGFGSAIVRVSVGTTDQTTPIFRGASHCESDLDAVLAIEWSDSEAAARARAWVVEECLGRGQKLIRLASKVRGDADLAEVSV